MESSGESVLTVKQAVRVDEKSLHVRLPREVHRAFKVEASKLELSGQKLAETLIRAFCESQAKVTKEGSV